MLDVYEQIGTMLSAYTYSAILPFCDLIETLKHYTHLILCGLVWAFGAGIECTT
jgi:hypothetical protein